MREELANISSAAITTWHQIWHQLRVDRPLRWAVVLLLIANGVLALIPVVTVGLENLGLVPDIDRAWSHIGEDGSVAEDLNHLQTVACAGFLFAMARRSGAKVHLAWALVFVFVFVDDAFQYHERVGGVLGKMWLTGLEPHDQQAIGELIAWALAGMVIMPFVLVQTFKARGETLGTALVCLAGFSCLAFFAIGVDGLHAALGGLVLFWIEDAGEMFVLAGLCAALAALWRRDHRFHRAGISR